MQAIFKRITWHSSVVTIKKRTVAFAKFIMRNIAFDVDKPNCSYFSHAEVMTAVDVGFFIITFLLSLFDGVASNSEYDLYTGQLVWFDFMYFSHPIMLIRAYIFDNVIGRTYWVRNGRECR